MARFHLVARLSPGLLVGLAACGDGTGPPRAGPPSRIEVASGSAFAGSVGTQLVRSLAARVTDDRDRPVSGAVVKFALVKGGGSLAPQSVATDADGRAQTALTFGIATGDYEVTAAVTGVPATAHFFGVATPGAASRVAITPAQVRLPAVGDTIRLRASLYDQYGNVVPSTAVAWTAADPAVFDIDQAGLVTGKQPLSTGRAIASASGRADTAYVVVANPDASPCLGYSAPVTLAIGQAVSVSMTDGACIASAGAGDEYVIVPWHGSTVGASTVAVEIMGSGLAPVTAPASAAPLTSRSGVPTDARTPSGDPVRSFELERKIRELGRRELMPMARRARDAVGGTPFSGARAAAIPASLGVGNLVQLNANIDPSCTSPHMRAGRVAAISSRAVVVADTANPPDGFTTADYQRYASAFDTLVAPLDEAAFGAATDIDRNGKVAIFFTRAVNELTPPAVNYYYGGFFHPRDLLPKQLHGSTYCAGSNEGEMFYMLVPDPAGVVNRNRRTIGFVDSITIGTLAHEFQHLINAGRRAYVNHAVADEEVWLNEGLSHIAEELLFYRVSGATPRQNIGGERFGTQPFDADFAMYMAPNFGRLRSYLQNPQRFSPYSPGDDLATRGASWAFLRYAADQLGPTDGSVWMRLVNSTTAGIQNLQGVFGTDVVSMIRDWTVSVYTDDYVAGVAAAYTQLSWNFRTAFLSTPAGRRPYPLVDAVRILVNDATQTVPLQGGSGAFFRFGVTAGGEAAVLVTAGGSVPPPTVQATVVRRQ
jgi:hypothetical protein